MTADRTARLAAIRERHAKLIHRAADYIEDAARRWFERLIGKPPFCAICFINSSNHEPDCLVAQLRDFASDITFVLTDNARLEAELAASEARVREARKVALEEAAKVADLYAETNLQIAGDTVLADPAFKPGPKDWKKSEDLMIKGCIASSMFHAAQNIAEAIRNLAQEGETK